MLCEQELTELCAVNTCLVDEASCQNPEERAAKFCHPLSLDQGRRGSNWRQKSNQKSKTKQSLQLCLATSTQELDPKSTWI
mmetsp:Transcript_16790/g.24865  ORF Transcript_16790/g.24865 Transcript_16790/m.24865 type:complete len:81 (+) Transcript_16790:219-461(+)